MAYELLAAYRAAQEEQAAIYIARAKKKVVNEALLHLRAEGITYLMESGNWREKVEALLRWNRIRFLWGVREEIREKRKSWTPLLANWKKNSVVKKAIGNAAIDELFRDYASEAIEKLEKPLFPLTSPYLLSNPDTYKKKSKTDLTVPYFRRKLIEPKVPIRFHPNQEKEAAQIAQKIGLDTGKPFVTLHVREAGYKQGREVSDKPNSVRDEGARNANIQDYFPAIDYLVSKGFTVVRIGDPLMTPIHRSGVIDLACSPHRTQTMELWCMANSVFFFGCESGPYHVAYLLNTNCLIVNCTDPICSFPVRTQCLFAMKKIRFRSNQKELTLKDILTEEYFNNLRNSSLYEYQDNSPEELILAVKEMLQTLEDWGNPTADQEDVRLALVKGSQALAPKVEYVRKWGAEGDFLGAGRLVEFQASAYNALSSTFRTKKAKTAQTRVADSISL